MNKKKEDSFNIFWDKYPRKVAKFSAKRSWNRLSLKEIDNIINVVDQHILRWKEKELQYIPHASTWINQKRFEDELEPLAKQGLSNDDKLEKKRVKFEKMMQEAEENIASPEEIKEALGLK